MSCLRRLPAQGFTMVEMMVVIIIMGMSLAIALPTLTRGNRARQVEGTAQELASRLQVCRQRAVATRVPQRLVLVPEESRYLLERLADDSTWSADAGDEFEVPPPVDLTCVAGGELGNHTIEFEPRGTVRFEDSPARIAVTNAYGDTFTVSLVRTGRVTLRRGSIE